LSCVNSRSTALPRPGVVKVTDEDKPRHRHRKHLHCTRVGTEDRAHRTHQNGATARQPLRRAATLAHTPTTYRSSPRAAPPLYALGCAPAARPGSYVARSGRRECAVADAAMGRGRSRMALAGRLPLHAVTVFRLEGVLLLLLLLQPRVTRSNSVPIPINNIYYYCYCYL